MAGAALLLRSQEIACVRSLLLGGADAWERLASARVH
jgi:hypothetical protein